MYRWRQCYPIRSTGGGFYEVVVAAVDDRSSDEKNAVPI
jgi:hypothetical protein